MSWHQPPPASSDGTGAIQIEVRAAVANVPEHHI
jgi:hypothetical protein